MYRLIIGKIVSRLSPNAARRITLWIIKVLTSLPLPGWLLKRKYTHPSLERSFFGIDFSSPVGIGCGLDRTTGHFDDLKSLGAAFVTVGPIALNPDRNASSVRDVIQRLGSAAADNDSPVIAVIVKGHDTATDDIPDEIERVYTFVYDFSDAVCIDLEGISADIIDEILNRVTTIRRFNDDHRAIIVKLPSKAPEADIDLAIHEILCFGIDGIAVNNSFGDGSILSTIREKSHDLLPIIVSGGISTPEAAVNYLNEGAALISVSDEIISEGPYYIRKLAKSIRKASLK